MATRNTSGTRNAASGRNTASGRANLTGAKNSNWCLGFNGTNNYVNCGAGSSLNFGTGDFSFEFWVQSRNIGTVQALYSKGTPISPYTGIFLSIASNGTIRFYHDCGATGGIGDIYGDTILSNNKWYHIVYSMNRDGNGVIYLNGVQDKSVDISGQQCSANHANSALIGVLDGTSYFNGLIDEVRIYNIALTSTQVQQHYQGIYLDETGLVGWWQFNETSGTLTADSSGNDNVGTLTGGPTWTKCDRNEVGLVGYWKMDDDEASTTVTDLSGEGNTGTFSDATGDPNTNAHSVAGQVGNALSFDGDDYVNCGAGASLNITSAITIEAWVKLASLNAIQGFLTRDDNVNRHYALSISIANTFYISVWTALGAQSAFSTTVLTTGIWYHLVGVYNGTDVRVFLNGVQDGAIVSQTGTIITGDTSVTIGARENGLDRFFNGTIDEVRIYNRALSAEEINQHYLAGL